MAQKGIEKWHLFRHLTPQNGIQPKHLHACSGSLRALVRRGKLPSTKARQAATPTHFKRTFKSRIGVTRDTAFCYFLTRKKFPHGGRHVGTGDFALGAITEDANLHNALR
jgi:hypothetical protein